MEAVVEVALLAERLMGSSKGFGSGGNSSGFVVGEVRWHTGDACSSEGVKAPGFWRKIPDSELCLEVCQPSSLQSDDASNDHGLVSMISHPLALDVDARVVLQKSTKIVRNSSGCTKRSRMVQMEVSKSKPGLHDVNGISSVLVSSPANCNISEKNQLVKAKNSPTSRRGDKRNSKVKHRNRCDSFFLKNGLVGFNSVAGGNNAFGIYGLKLDIFDITKYVNELSLDELLSENYSCPCPAKDKGKKAADSNNNLMQSVRKACSVLQARKVLQAQNCAEIDNSCIQKVSTSLITVSTPVGQTDGYKGDSCATDPHSTEEVQESDDKIKMSNTTNPPLYHPKNVLGRLALPPQKDFDLLLSDANKTTSSKSSVDPRLGKPISHRTGLPPFPWSHSFSAHSKLGSDAVKLSTSRTICQGRWVKVKNSAALQKGSADLLVDFELLTFDQSLVPLISLSSEHPQNEFAPNERILSTPGACSTSKVPSDEYSPTHAAAQILLNMASYSSLKEYPSATVKLLKRPSQMAMKASKLRAIERSDKLFDTSKSTLKPANPLKVGDDGFPSKKLRLSTDVRNAHTSYTEPMRKGTLNWPAPLLNKSPPKRLFRDLNANTGSYGINPVKKLCMLKPPRGIERSSSSQQKFRKTTQ